MVVADASVLIYLIKLDRIQLLGDLYERLYVTDVVHSEVAHNSKDGLVLDAAEFVRVAIPNQYSGKLQHVKLSKLDPGERSALAFCLSVNQKSLLLADDKAARAAAAAVGIKCTGLLGILGLAKQHGLISLIAPLADRAIAAGYRIHPELYRKFLATVDE